MKQKVSVYETNRNIIEKVEVLCQLRELRYLCTPQQKSIKNERSKKTAP